jgi:hypothetical protein
MPAHFYDDEVMIVALRLCWAALGPLAGKRMAPCLPEAGARLLTVGELDLDKSGGSGVMPNERGDDRPVASG